MKRAPTLQGSSPINIILLLPRAYFFSSLFFASSFFACAESFISLMPAKRAARPPRINIGGTEPLSSITKLYHHVISPHMPKIMLISPPSTVMYFPIFIPPSFCFNLYLYTTQSRICQYLYRYLLNLAQVFGPTTPSGTRPFDF